jgi:hypothetical protein
MQGLRLLKHKSNFDVVVVVDLNDDSGDERREDFSNAKEVGRKNTRQTRLDSTHSTTTQLTRRLDDLI